MLKINSLKVNNANLEIAKHWGRVGKNSTL